MADDPSDTGWLKNGQGVIALLSAVVGVFSAAWALWSSVDAHHAQTAADQSSHESAAKAAEASASAQAANTLIAQHQDDRTRIMTVYTEVTNALQSHQEDRELAALALVQFYLKTEPDLQTQLATLVQNNGTDKARAQASSLTFNLQQAQPTLGAVVNAPAAVAASSVGDLKGYRVDIFWCNSSRAGLDKFASDLSAQVSAHTTGAVRARFLPPEINRAPGYGLKGVVLRYEASESAIAAKLKAIVSPSLTGAKLVDNDSAIGMQQISYRTPNYISMFVCTGAIDTPPPRPAADSAP